MNPFKKLMRKKKKKEPIPPLNWGETHYKLEDSFGSFNNNYIEGQLLYEGDNNHISFDIPESEEQYLDYIRNHSINISSENVTIADTTEFVTPYRSYGTINTNSTKAEYLSEEFLFIEPDIFLEAKIDTKTLRQQLVIKKKDEEGRVIDSHQIMCINTVLDRISYEEYDKITDINEFTKTKQSYISLDGKPEILSLEEKFKAFKSWTAGIAEAGLNALYIQSEIEKLMGRIVPISSRFFNFLLRSNPKEFIFQYVDFIEKECRFENTLHEPSLFANLIILFRTLEGRLTSPPIIKMDLVPIIQRIFELDFDYNKFFKKNQEFVLCYRKFRKIDPNVEVTRIPIDHIVSVTGDGMGQTAYSSYSSENDGYFFGYRHPIIDVLRIECEYHDDLEKHIRKLQFVSEEHGAFYFVEDVKFADYIISGVEFKEKPRLHIYKNQKYQSGRTMYIIIRLARNWEHQPKRDVFEGIG